MMDRARVFLILLAALAFSAPAQAEDGPSFDCAAAEGMAEEMICQDADLATLDQTLAARFGAALAVAEALDAGADEAVSELRAMQRGWIGGRNDCWKAEDTRACIEQAYLTREAELVALWMLEPPRATVRYVCGGNPANEVYAMFFDTGLPALRIEYGDSIAAGWLVPAASGSRYALPFGRGLWIKGEEATLTWPEGTDQTCQAQT